MSRLASPATGCHLRLVEVQVGDDVETYDATTLDEPLEFSLQGQRSLGSEIGTLLLIISTGSKQMLSLRLSDLLNHPDGTEETITIDKQTHQIRVRLPNLDHTLRLSFQHSRDFLVSVCILRKTGFAIEEGLFYKTGTQLGEGLNANKPVVDLVGPPRRSAILPPAARPQRASTSQAQDPNSSQDTAAPDLNIFDEVLDRLKQAGNKTDVLSTTCSDTPPRPEDFPDVSLQNPDNVFATKWRTTDQPTVHFPPQASISHENLESHGTSNIREEPKQSAAADPPPPRRHHGYFTRSFSLAARRLGANVNKEDHSLSVRKSSHGNRPPRSKHAGSPADNISSSFDSSPTVDFRNLMPHRRRLPFLEAKRTAKRSRANENGTLGVPKPAVDAPPADAPPGSKTQASDGHPVCGIPDILVLLMQMSALDELEMKSSPLYKQYEQDVAHGRHDEQRATFYLDSLQNLRTSFWLDRLQKVGDPDYAQWAEW